MGFGEIGLLPDRFGHVCDGLIQLAPFEQHGAEIVVGVGRVDAARDHDFVLPDGLIEMAQRLIEIAEAGPRFGEFGLQFEGMRKGLQGLLVAPTRRQCIAKTGIERRNIAAQTDGFADQLQTHFGAAGSRRKLADHMQAFNMARISLKRSRIELLGFGKPPCRVMIERDPIEFGAIDPRFQGSDFRGRKSARCCALQHGAGFAGRARQQQRLRKRQPMLALQRIRLQRGVQERKRGLRLALTHGQRTERVIGLRMVRFGLQDAAEQPLGVFDRPASRCARPLRTALLPGRTGEFIDGSAPDAKPCASPIIDLPICRIRAQPSRQRVSLRLIGRRLPGMLAGTSGLIIH